MKRALLLSMLTVVFITTALAAQVPQEINYQGVLTTGGGAAVPDGMYSIDFRLYELPEGGSPVWNETHAVSVEGGIFNVVLGSAGSPLDLGFENQYWLGLAVEAGDELAPRRPLAATPYSLNARMVNGPANLFPPDGNVGIGTKTPVERLDVDGAIRLGGTDGVNAGAIRWTGADFEGYNGDVWQSLTASGGGGLPAGAAGQTLRHNGADWASSSNLYNDGTNIGIGTATPQHELHVIGIGRFDLPSSAGQISISTPGGWPGIIAYSSNGDRRDIIYNDDAMILSASPSSAAPSAYNGMTLFDNGQICIGDYTPSEKLHIRDTGATYVNIDAPTGYATGVVYSIENTAQWRQLYNPAEGTFQFYREGSGPKMVIGNGGRVGIGTTTLDGTTWLQVHSPNPSPGHSAITGYSYFNASPSFGGGIGVAGIHSDDGVGGVGVYGEATSGAPLFDTQIGVYGYTNDGYGVYSDGTLATSGEVVSIAPTRDYGHRRVYAVQSTGNWFEDFGEGRLDNGEAIVEIDPVFAQTVSPAEGYHVFLTPLGDGALYVAEKTDRHFVVRSRGSGEEDIAFDYRIVAKRRGFESKRLEAARDPAEMRRRSGIPVKPALGSGS